ncbi:hypothetical protein LguiA_010646 [Lonicera macranthoides]
MGGLERAEPPTEGRICGVETGRTSGEEAAIGYGNVVRLIVWGVWKGEMCGGFEKVDWKIRAIFWEIEKVDVISPIAHLCVEGQPLPTDKNPLPPPRSFFLVSNSGWRCIIAGRGSYLWRPNQDMSAIVNKVYDILKVTRMGDYENSIPERRSKRLHDLSLTVSTPGRAKAPPRKKSKK